MNVSTLTGALSGSPSASLLARAPGVTTDSINAIFESNIDAITSGFSQAQGAATDLLIALTTLEFLLFCYRSYLEPDLEEVMAKGLQKIAMLVIVVVMTLNWATIAGGLRGYLVGAGSAVVGESSATTSMNPAVIAAQGVDKIAIIFNAEAREQIVAGTIGNAQVDRLSERNRRRAEAENRSYFMDPRSTIEGFGEELMVGLEAMALEVLVLFVFAGVALLIVGVHFYVALQMFVLTLDWYLTVSITSLLIPFAVNKHTSPLASSALNAVVGKSIQLAVMIMVLGMFGRALDGLQLSAAPTLYEMLALLLGTSTLAFMIARVPEISRGIFSSGGQAIDVGGIVVAAASGAASAMAAGALASAKGVGDRDVFGDGDDPGAGSGAPRGGGGAGGEAIELAGLDATTMEPSSGADEPPLVMGEGGAVASEAQADRALSQDDRRAELERSDALTDAVRSRGSQEQPMSVEEALRELDSRDDDDEGARPEVSSGADQEDGQW
jgi:hypothetical protein